MLRLSKHILAATAATALVAGTPAFSQGLGTRITDAGKKLDQDTQACRSIDLGEYVQLLNEAGQNKVRAEKAAKKGVPIDQAQVDADLANASALFARAQAALVQQCMRQAQQAAQPQAQPQAATGGHGTLGPGEQAGAAALGGQNYGTCPSGPPPQKASAPAGPQDSGPRVPSAEEIENTGNKMVEAYEKGQHGEAGFLRGELDQESARLSKMIKDAKPLGDMANFNVKEAEQRLKKIDDLRKYAESKGIRPCSDLLKPSNQAQPQITPPAETPKQGAMSLPPFARDVLAAHNAARAAVGSPPLKWNPEIASQEQSWAEVLSQRGTLDHRPREGRGNVRENLARVPEGYSVGETIDRWTRERSQFVPGTFPNVCTTGGDCSGVLHYTQMVWYETTDLGCGEARSGGFLTVACGYGPGGNKDGKPVLGTPLQIAQNSTIRARPVGGDYGGGATAVGETIDKLDPDDEFWASSVGIIAKLSEDTRLDLGSGDEDYEGGDAKPYTGGIFWDPVSGVTVGAGASFVDLLPDEPEVDTKVGVPSLPTGEVFKPSQPVLNPKYQEFIQKHWDHVMKMADGTPYEKALSGFAVGFAMYQEGRKSCNEGLKQAGEAQAKAAIEALKQMKAQMSEVGKFSVVEQSEIDTTIEDYESLMNHDKPGAQKAAAKDDSPTKVDQPALPTKEVYNPADAPRCALDVM